MNRLIHLKKATPLLVATFVLACFALSPQARGVCQDGCNTSNNNTFQGDDALMNNMSGNNNTATGSHALFHNTGNNNTANGSQALVNNTTGDDNTAVGANVLANNESSGNTAVGTSALAANTSGSVNTAVGAAALGSNLAGIGHCAFGFEALFMTTTGSIDNSAFGNSALGNNTTGSFNVAFGADALVSNMSGDHNTGIGSSALLGCSGNDNIALGYQAGDALTTGDNNIDIGNAGVPGESNTIRIGTQGAFGTHTATFIAGISGVNIGKGLVVEIDASGHLGTRGSSRRFKDQIKPMDKASEAILGLKPVIFRYKKEIDPDGTPQFGLVAEQVEKVNPDLVVRDKEGKPYSVRYDAVNAMLLNEFLKEHREVQELKKQVEALTAGLQRVSAHLELSKSAPRTALKVSKVVE
jgi:hypothetical protein